MVYDYRGGKRRIKEILNNNTEVYETQAVPSDENFTFDNSYYSWITAIFVDIRDSSTLFSNSDKVMVSKIIRSFTSEIIEILRQDNKLREIGIRVDCVYAVFSTPHKADIRNVAIYTSWINSEIKMLNNLLAVKGYETIKVGIGVSSAQELVIKAGRKNTGINSKVWIGDAVTKASNLSSIGNKDGICPIVFSSLAYSNFIDIWEKEDINAKSWFNESYSIDYGTYYHADIIQVEFNNWIEEGMPE